MTSIPPAPAPRPGPEAGGPGTPGLDALLAAALAAELAEERGAGAPVPTLDPAAEAARLERLLAADEAPDAVAAPGDLTLLADLVAAQAAAEAQDAAGRAPALAGHVARAVTEAGATLGVAPAEPAHPARTTGAATPASAQQQDRATPAPVAGARGARRAGARLLAAAALLLALGGAYVLRGGSRAEAAPVLALHAVERWSLSARDGPVSDVGVWVPSPGAAEMWFRAEQTGPRVASLGERFAAGDDEVLALALGSGGRVGVVRGGRAAVSPTRVPQPGVAARESAVLALAGGEALLDADDGFAALLLEPVGARAALGLLLLAAGQAHVALPSPCGENGCEPGLALAPGARARWLPARGEAVDLSGPLEARLSSQGAVPVGAPARSLFRDLSLLGGALHARQVEPFVDVALWRVISGRVRRGGAGLALSPARRTADQPADAPDVVLAWAPDPGAGGARVLRLLLDGPAALDGLTATLPDLGVSAVLTGAAAEPGLSTVDLALPEGWSAGLPRGELRLSLTWPVSPDGARPEARLRGVTLSRWPVALEPR